MALRAEHRPKFCSPSQVMAFEQGGIFIVPHLLLRGDSVFPVSSEGPPHSISSYDSQGDAEDLFLPGSSRVPFQSHLSTCKWVLRTYSYPDPQSSPFSRLLQHARGCWGPILTRVLTGLLLKRLSNAESFVEVKVPEWFGSQYRKAIVHVLKWEILADMTQVSDVAPVPLFR
jgi:hypothetical protein